MDEDDKIVEFFNESTGWDKTTLRDVKFLCLTLGHTIMDRMRYIEASLDGGVIWKEMYESELMLLTDEVYSCIQWRAKEK